MAQKVGLILGGNRGIGRALVALLAERWGESGLVYLTARSASAAREAQESLSAATGLPLRSLVFDLAQPEDAARVARQLAAEHGGIDAVFQNGAYIARAGVDAADDARPMIEANSHGTLRVLEAFLPVLRERGHLIIVASALGTLSQLPEHLRPRFDSSRCTPLEINAAIDGYVDAVEAGRADAEGWPGWVNVPSKVAQVAVTRAFARVAYESGQLPAGARINAACPGLALTDATRDFMGTVFKAEDAQTPEAAAAGLLGLLDLPPETYGELLQHGEVLPFDDG